MIDLQELHDEIEADPQAIGYKNPDTTWKDDAVIVTLINDPANGAQITRKLVQPREIVASLDLAEFEALTAAQRAYLAVLVSGDTVVDANEASIFDALTTLFAGGSTTRAALLAKIQRQGSRAEVLWGEGAVVTAGMVGDAANLGA